MRQRPQKIFKLHYLASDVKANKPYLQLLDNPGEAKLGATLENFISIRENGITLSPGIGNNINIQGLPQNMRYAGMLSDLPFPLSVIPTTPFTPFPKQIFNPPLKELIPIIAELTVAATSFIS